jgi:hypothetical protein
MMLGVSAADVPFRGFPRPARPCNNTGLLRSRWVWTVLRLSPVDEDSGGWWTARLGVPSRCQAVNRERARGVAFTIHGSFTIHCLTPKRPVDYPPTPPERRISRGASVGAIEHPSYGRHGVCRAAALRAHRAGRKGKRLEIVAHTKGDRLRNGQGNEAPRRWMPCCIWPTPTACLERAVARCWIGSTIFTRTRRRVRATRTSRGASRSTRWRTGCKRASLA